MDFSKINLFAGIKKRLAWLSQRQEILAQNIANANTPGAQARDIEPFEFKRMVRARALPVNMEKTNPQHLTGFSRPISDFNSEVTTKPYETSIDGNAIVLEEQMLKIGETGASHELVTELYKKHIGMFRAALGTK